MLVKYCELYIVNVVPESPNTVGLVIDTSDGEPNYNDVTLFPVRNITPILEFLTSIVVRLGQFTKSIIYVIDVLFALNDYKLELGHNEITPC